MARAGLRKNGSPSDFYGMGDNDSPDLLLADALDGAVGRSLQSDLIEWL